MAPAVPHAEGMWVQVEGITVKEGDEPLRLAPPGAVMDEGIYAVTRRILPPRAADGVEPIPGTDPLPAGSSCYWLTGTVGSDIRDLNEGHRFRPGEYRFLLTAGEMRFAGKYSAKRRHGGVQPGSRVTLECSFLLGAGWDWDWDDLPDEWVSNWRVLQVLERRNPDWPSSDYVISVEPVSIAPSGGDSDPENEFDAAVREGEEVRAFLAHPGPFAGYQMLHTEPLPLLLDAGQAGGPLWYRGSDDRAAWSMSLDSLRLSTSLRDRLTGWAAAAHDAHREEGEEPDHEAAGYQEGYVLLAEIRAELAPDYDIKLAHDLDA